MPRGLDPKTQEAYEKMAFDEQLHSALAAFPDHDNNLRVSDRIHCIWNDITSTIPHPQLVSNFFSWVGLSNNREHQPLLLHKLLKERRSHISRLHSQKRRVINLSNLNSGSLDKDAFLRHIPIRHCERLAFPFPPPSLYVSETKDIFDRNMAFVLEHELPDSRIPRKFIFRLDKSTDFLGLACDLGPCDEAQFVDENGDLVAVVIRNACKDSRIVDFVDKTVKKVVQSRRNVRKEDRGHISQMGLSAGSRSNPSLGWVRNIERQKKNINFHQEVNYDASSSFAVLWSLVRALLPNVILHDFETFIANLGPDLRMDGNHTMDASLLGRGSYHIQMQDANFKFQNAELAPPCGVVAENYCRYIHFEKQPHTWAVSLTTSRQFDPAVSSLDAGGHFFISAYGIRIQSAPNTLIAWRPSDWHGTSLFHISPDSASPRQQYFQRGLCIVTGMRIVDAVKKWRAGQIKDEELDKIEERMDDGHDTQDESGGAEIDNFIEALQSAPLRRSARLANKPRKDFSDC
ncbi:hypothetical protein Agabi119p4_6888 [Agaricus bisporus var. burnettii]|uniref:Uncharacterized protein n=1 Tax=Agaricus bisporus var. burnettii TaxID=192524 RepID=A0A8H7KFA4_AGABI|nr:hypothetical protein Agabi119p4_6888 [Agaricus bisporus var. burnettii]